MLVDPRPDCATCGCPAEVHEHYRAGSDCGRCVTCRNYQRPHRPLLKRLARLVKRARC